MSELKPRITENGIDYILVGDYYIPGLKLPEEHRPIGKYGRMHREYLREVHPDRLNTLILTGELWTYLADLDIFCVIFDAICQPAVRTVTSATPFIYNYITARRDII